MTTRLDTFSPDYIGENLIVISQDTTTNPAISERPLTVNFDYSLADDEGGVVLPLVFQAQPLSGDSGYKRQVFNRSPPPSFTFIPLAAGDYLITLGESGHNRWFGTLRITVTGDPFTDLTIASS